MAEETEYGGGGGGGGGDKRSNGLVRPSLNPPRLSPSERISTTTTTSSCLRLLKKTRYAPDLFVCHSCGLRFPSNNNNPLDHLRSLRSQWRVALLCRACLSRVKSAHLCSYCFSPVSDAASLSCLRCSCRVHLGCADREHRCVAPWRPEPASFTCVDCCAIPKYLGRNPGIDTKVSLEDVAREASSMAEKKAEAAARARENAVKKAAAAKHATERARSALGAVLVANGKIPKQNADLTVVPDEELALRLHLAMNGSRRILRNLCSLSSGGGSVDLKKVRRRSGPVDGDTDSDGGRICKTVETCAEDKFFLDMVERTAFDQGSALEAHSKRTDQKNPGDENGKVDSVDIPLKEDQGSCSEKVVSSHGDDRSFDSISLECERKKESNSMLLSSTCRRDVIEDSEVPEINSITTPDRFSIKYSKRNSRLKGLVDDKDSQLVPSPQISCSEVSRTLIDCPYESSQAAVHSSACINGFSGCQS